MAFPADLEIEVAFNNDIDETQHAQTGWTSILPFVANFSGDLRGRSYELDRTEAGTLSVTIDNGDGRFLPGSVQSPYYPYVKSDRRFRIRGKNMVHPNVARGGSRDRTFTGFLDPIPGITATASVQQIKAFDTPILVSVNAEPNAGQGKEKLLDGVKTTMWTINTQAGWAQYQYPVSLRMQTYSLTIPAGNTNRNPDDWTLQGSNNGSSWTTIHTVTGNTWTEDYETQTFTITSPGFYTYYRLDITGNVGGVSNTQLAEWSITYADAATDLPTGNDDLTHYLHLVTATGMETNKWHEFVGWYVPLEYGVRLAHSAYVWRLAGTEPTGLKYKVHLVYLDDEFQVVGSTEGIADPNAEVSSLPTSTVPTQIGFSHTPPSTAKYGVMTFAVWIGSTTNAGGLTYGITGVQSELPVNLAPDISGYRDTFNWQIETEGTAGTVTSVATSSGTGAIVEATSPAYVSGNATTITTASFTPANNSLLVAMVAAGNGTGGAISLGAVTDSLGGTWTRVHYDYAGFAGLSEVWMRDISTGASMTVTWNPGGTVASGLSMKVQVLTGAKPLAQQTGALACINGIADFTKAITTTAPNSRIYGAFGRAQTAVALVGNGNTTIYGQIQGSAGDVASAFKSGEIDTPQSVTMGFTNMDTAGQYMTLVEVLAANQSAADPTTASVLFTWGVDDKNGYITIPHLIPGEWYTATIEAKKSSGGQPDALFSGDEGETGVLINTTSFAQYTTDFIAQQPEQELRFILQSTPSAAAGLEVRKLRVEIGENLSLSLPTTALETGVTSWIRPKDIFEGWVERWPAIAGQNEMSITVVDRMKRLSDIELSNTLRESLIQDSPVLLMPLSDSMIDTPGRFSQLGSWAEEEGGPSFVDITASRGDVGASTYTTATDDGPTGEASFKNNPADISQNTGKGYFFAIPYSKDYVTPLPPVIIGPKPKPPRPSVNSKVTATKKWYATWSRSYEGDNSTRFDDSPYMYQGQISGGPGIQKSLAGFDYNNIRATLAGETEILEVYITVKNAHARWNKGLYVFVGSHNYSSKPSTWSGATVQERRWRKWVVENGSVTINAGTSFGNQLKAGTMKGIGIGPDSDTDNYGYFFGASHSARPYITIKYRKSIYSAS